MVPTHKTAEATPAEHSTAKAVFSILNESMKISGTINHFNKYY
jgi:hypothetical protein